MKSIRYQVGGCRTETQVLTEAGWLCIEGCVEKNQERLDALLTSVGAAIVHGVCKA